MVKPKPQAQQDLDRRIVGSEPAANRIAEAMRLLPFVLLRDDPRVQTAFAVWWKRMADREAAGDFSDKALEATILDDIAQLNALVRELGLVKYISWLPRMLHWEFHRTMEEFDVNEPVDLEVSVPLGLPWATRGKKPKQRAGSMGGYRLENLERVVELFYRCEVKSPREPKKRIAINEGIARSDVQHAVKRARALLDCIDARLPDSPAA